MIAPLFGSKIALFTDIPNCWMFWETSEKKLFVFWPFVDSATFANAISAGVPSPKRFPNWKIVFVNSDSRAFVFFLARIKSFVFSL